jgi:phenylalanyl-tRNA synthetase beta chain
VKITDSPEWLKKRILSIGLRPRNNIVDITNFVMFETGQPLHSFDYEKIRKKGIVVKTANEGDKFTTLDGKERILNSKSLMVCDKEGYSAIAGIMGGEFSEITEDTKNIFLESAYFDPVCVRKNSKNLGLQTDASQRFERGVDIDIVEYASNRASSLIQEIAGGEVLEGLIDVYPEKFEKLFVGITAEKTSKILGKKFTKEKIKELLEKIEIAFVKEENSELIFEIPEFRRYDLTREIDLIEEVARLYGYDNLESDFRFCIDTTSHRDYEDEFRKFVKNIRSYFIGRGFNEIITYSQQDKNKVEQFSENYVSIENPNSVEMNTMRINLEYGMLDVIKKNFNFSGTGIPLRLFEIGKVFLERDEKYTEKNILSFAISGKFDFLSFNSEERVFDFFDLKGETDMLMSKLNLENCKYIYYNEQNKLCFVLNNEEFGVIKQVNKSHNDLFELENDVYIAEFDLNILFKNSGLNKFFNKISKFPSVKRDLAIVVNDDVKYNDLEEHIKESAGKLLNSVSLFDIYTGEKIGRGKKSMTFTLEFLSGEKTLTDNEINITVNKILKSLNKKLSAELRT